MRTWWWGTELTKADTEAQSARDPILNPADLDDEQLMEYQAPEVVE